MRLAKKGYSPTPKVIGMTRARKNIGFIISLLVMSPRPEEGGGVRIGDTGPEDLIGPPNAGVGFARLPGRRRRMLQGRLAGDDPAAKS